MFFVLIIVVGAIIAVFLILNVLYKRTRAYKNLFFDAKKYNLISNSDSFDIVNIGSNQPKFAFNYHDIDVNAMNWSLGPQTFEYDYIILKKYAKYLHEGSIVIIPVCPLSFFSLIFKSRNSLIKYNIFMDYEDIPDNKRRPFQRIYNVFPLLSDLRLAVKIILDDKNKEQLTNQYIPMNQIQIEKDAEYWIKYCWNPEFNINIEKMDPLSEINIMSISKNIQILSDIISFCLSNHFTPIIALLPVTLSLRNKFSSQFIEDHILSYIMKAVSGRDIKVYNYLDDHLFMNNKYYFNSFFMNRQGSILFTNHFLKKIGFL